MQTIPMERWESLCTDLSSQYQGCPSTIETVRAEDDRELLAVDVPFGGLRLEGSGDALRIIAVAGGDRFNVLEGPGEITLTAGADQVSHVLTFRATGLLGVRISLTDVGASRLGGRAGGGLPLRERAVGQAEAAEGGRSARR